jgi:hypothetical protein
MVIPVARRIKMRTIGFMLSLFMVAGISTSRADINIGISGNQDGLKEFHLAIGDYFNVPLPQIEIVREKQVNDEELPVIFFLAQRAKVPPDSIVNLRLGGKSWMDITYYYGMGADIYYVKAKGTDGPPYGRAYGYYKNKPQKEWKYVKLNDEDVINLVNLRFISSHYGYEPDEVIKMRSNGKSFMAINKDAKDHKIKLPEKTNKAQKSAKANKSSKK